MKKKEVEDMNFKELVQLLANKFKKEYYDDKGKTEEDFKKYLEDFEKAYHIHLRKRTKETPILVNTFGSLIDDIFELNEFQISVLGTQAELEKKLLENLTDEQANILKELQGFQNIVSSEMIGQAFVFGYATAIQLREDLKKYTKNKISE